MEVTEDQVPSWLPEPSRSSDSQPNVQELNRLLQLQRDQLGNITQNLPIKTILHSICQDIEALIAGSYCYVMLLHPVTGQLNLKCAPSIDSSHRELFRRVVPGPKSRACGTAVFADQPVFCSHLRTDPRWKDSLAIADTLAVESAWAYPLHDANQHPSGAIGILFETSKQPSPIEARTLETAAYLCSIALNQHISSRDLKASEQRFSHVAASIPGVVLQAEFTPKGLPYFSFVSSGIEALCGVTSDEAYRNFNSVWKRVPHEDQQRIFKHLENPASAPWSVECRVTDGNDQLKWVHLAATPEWRQDGKLHSLNCILLDISREKEAHAQLELAGIAFQSTTEGIVVTDHLCQIVDANRAFCEMTGYSRAELLRETPHLLSSNTASKQQIDAIFEHARSVGHWQGEVWHRRKSGASYPQWMNINAVYNAQQAVTHFVIVAADVTDIKESEAKLRHLTHHDALTDLPNRKLFKKLVDHVIDTASDAQHCAVLMIDLDRFKHVNETMGHQEGDQLLIQVARRLQETLDETAILARIGGDEFAIFVEQCAHFGAAEKIAMQVVDAMECTFELGGRSFFTTASLGISLFPEHGFDSETLIKNADTALHQAKSGGRNKYACYQPEQTERIEQWVRLEPALRNALESEQFEVYYQPQIDALTGKISGAEALLRWNHPTEGLISPGQFIPILEEIGLMTRVGNWVLEQAVKQALVWRQSGFPNFRIAVNIAGPQILSGGLVELVERLLKDSHLTRDLLELEIVETMVMQHANAAQPVLQRLRELGVRIALDDFGTGYSSLSYLKMLPVQKVKIDQSLVRDIPEDPNDEAIARAVIALSHSLNLSVCAEGVETYEQQAFLRRENCDQLQGYLISRPMSVAQMNLWLQQQISIAL
ncbi:EAL domain-containing protein [Neptunomonas sp. XY-337]|uniref:sensor domain-containing phosphodiesterase n=1 Tax=Neptunomonas sp. XY-337 TaxID=2561897 RepID=UPI0010A9B54A|nr:EAL domain-containing protein [Neptunomonas sp. XY-337]